MYKIIKAGKAKIRKLETNQHIYDLIGTDENSNVSLSIIESAESTQKFVASQDTIHYILDGTMAIDDLVLEKGDCCLFQKGDSVIVSGTFRALCQSKKSKHSPHSNK